MYRLSAIILAFFITISCSTTQKIATFKPEPDDASPLIYDNVPSFIDLPITIKLKETFVTKTNLMGGKEFTERYDTPYYCSPASESYWSM